MRIDPWFRGERTGSRPRSPRSLRVLPLFLIPFALAIAAVSAASDPAARAEAARLANRTDEAIPLYREALASKPDWAEGWFHLGALLYSRDECGEARPAFETAVSLRPDVGTGWAMLGLCEFQLGGYEKSLEHLNKASELGIDPQLRHVVTYHRGRLLLGRGEFERAQEALGTLAAEGIEDEPLLIALGQSVLRHGGFEPPTDPNTVSMLMAAGRAELLAARKQFEDAEREYRRIATEYAHVRNAHYALGRYYGATTQPEKAVAAYEQELERFPDHIPALVGIAAIKLETDPEAARAYAEKAVALNPRIPLSHYVLGSILLRIGEIDRAITELETAERSVREDPGLYFALARAYARAGRKEDAERARATFTRLQEAQRAAAERQSEGQDGEQR